MLKPEWYLTLRAALHIAVRAMVRYDGLALWT
jgi:hypothetical protein